MKSPFLNQLAGCDILDAMLKLIKRNFLTRVHKKFYKDVKIVKIHHVYGITLDERFLKTPLGNKIEVPSKSLALSIVTEWQLQNKTIEKNSMHFTPMVNVVLDKFIQRDKEDICQDIMAFLDNDTLWHTELTDLSYLQSTSWDPIIKWFNKRHSVSINVTNSFIDSVLDQQSKDVILKNLMSYNKWALSAFLYSSEATKSFMLTSALMEGVISAKEATNLALLEEIYQTDKWGQVEWAHDISKADIGTRLASAMLFAQFIHETPPSNEL